MKFVGGPFHGTDVPAEIVEQSEKVMLGNTHIIRLTDLSTGGSTLYVQRWWWQGVGKPLLPFFAPANEGEEEVMEKARGVMQC